jgi:hypothetical protein
LLEADLAAAAAERRPAGLRLDQILTVLAGLGAAWPQRRLRGLRNRLRVLALAPSVSAAVFPPISAPEGLLAARTTRHRSM